MNIYVGNLAYSLKSEDLKEMFAPFGEVSRASVIMDKATNRSKGFGFVEMADAASGNAAIKEMDGKDVGGRPLRVNEAQPRQDRPRRF